MDQPTANHDDDEAGMRHERIEPVSPRSKARDALQIGIEIPVSYVIVGLLLAAFNAGAIWFQFGALVDITKKLQDSQFTLNGTAAEIKQHATYQDVQLLDHEARLRSVERKVKP